MSTIIDKVKSMGNIEIWAPECPKPLCTATCKCGNVKVLTVGAIYKQYQRGRRRYLCQSCIIKLSWNEERRKKASIRTKKLWSDPNYAGTIIGKALARDISRKAGI